MVKVSQFSSFRSTALLYTLLELKGNELYNTFRVYIYFVYGLYSWPTSLMRRCSWLRHCATSRIVPDFIPSGVIKNFH